MGDSNEESCILAAVRDPNIIWEALDDRVLQAVLHAAATSAPGAPRAGTPSGGASTSGAPAALHDAGTTATSLDRLQRCLAAGVPHEWTAHVHRLDAANGGDAGDAGEGDENAAPQQAAKRARTGPQQHRQQQQQQQLRRRPRAPGLFAATVGCTAGGGGGIYAFGGLAPGGAPRVQLGHSDPWLNEAGPMRQLPDHSRLLKSGGDLAVTGTVICAAPPGAQVPTATAGAAASSASPAEGASAAAADNGWRFIVPRHRLSCGLVGHSAVEYRGRVYLWGGQLDDKAADYSRPADASPGVPMTCDTLRGYAVTEEGRAVEGEEEQLPVVSDFVVQNGHKPSARMHHSAAVDPEGGVMYLYGGVTYTLRTAQRRPADTKAGLLYAYTFATSTWEQIVTQGDCPTSTTLLAMAFHEGSLWAIPQLPTPRTGTPASNPAPAYRLHRFDPGMRRWATVRTRGAPPSPRTEAAVAFLRDRGALVVFGGRDLASGRRVLGDASCLDLSASQPAWTQLRPATIGGEGEAGSSGGLVPVSGAGGAALGSAAVFVGGSRRLDIRSAEPLVQVLQRCIVPATPDAAAASESAKARQHCRLQLAKLLRSAGNNSSGSGGSSGGGLAATQVLLVPGDGGTPVRLPAVLLALHSRLFFDMAQSGILGAGSDDEGTGGSSSGGSAPLPPARVPVDGVTHSDLRTLCRWVAGLACLNSLPLPQLARIHLAADRLVMEGLLSESLQLLRAAVPRDAEGAAALLSLAGELSGRPELREVGDRAERLLAAGANPNNAARAMALAVAYDRPALRRRCESLMNEHRSADVWGVLRFALRFGLPWLQAACLARLSEATKGRLLWHADTVVEVAERHVREKEQGGGAGGSSAHPNSTQQQQNQAAGRPSGSEPDKAAAVAGAASTAGESVAAAVRALPVLGMLQRDLLAEQQAAGLKQLSGYVSAADRLGLPQLRQGLVRHVAAQWGPLNSVHGALLRTLKQEHPSFMVEVAAMAGSGAGPGGGVGPVPPRAQPLCDDIDALFE